MRDRDYRFYEADMIHPNAVAVKYVWDKLVAAMFKNEAVHTMAEVRYRRSKYIFTRAYPRVSLAIRYDTIRYNTIRYDSMRCCIPPDTHNDPGIIVIRLCRTDPYVFRFTAGEEDDASHATSPV